MKGKNNITSKQLALLTFVEQTGMGIVILPALLSKSAGHDGWIVVLLAGMLAIIVGILIVSLLKLYKDKIIYDINKIIFGKILGTIFNLALAIYLFLAAAASARIFSVFLRLTLFPRTPPMVLVPFSLLPSIYLVYCGLKYIARFKYVSVISYVITTIYLLMLLGYYRFSFLLPVGEAGITQILTSIKTGFYAFFGLEIIVFVYTEVTDKEKVMKWQVVSTIYTTLFSILIVIATTALFGENFLKLQTIPLFNLGRVYNAPIFERLDLYLIALWFIVMGCSMRYYMFAAYNSLEKIFKIKDSKLAVICFFIMLIFVSRVPKDINEAFSFKLKMSYAGMGVCLFLILCLVLSLLRLKGGKPDESC